MTATTTTAPVQPCPLCGQPAVYEVFRAPDCEHFTCPTCTDFCIDAAATSFMRNTTEEARQRASAEARRVGPDYMCVFREPNTEEHAAQPTPRSMVVTQLVPLHHTAGDVQSNPT